MNLRPIICALLFACAPDPAQDATDDTPLAPLGNFECADFTPTVVDEPVQTLTGQIVWNVDFHASAEADGFTDCSYARNYDGVEDRTVQHLCPDCEVVFRSSISFEWGLAECYSKIASSSPDPDEWIGWTGDGEFRRASLNVPLNAAGSVDITGTAVSTLLQTDYPAPDSDPAFGFDIQGSFTLSEDASDPYHGLALPDAAYAAGWPRSERAQYTGDYITAFESTLPDVVFIDQCGQPVRLHDFADRYLVLQMSALDCPACVLMAEGEGAFIDSLRSDGVEVETITLMAPTLRDVLGLTEPADLLEWAEVFDLHSPILQDRGYALWQFGGLTGEYGSYPTWILVDRELQVFASGIGFGSWDALETRIRDREDGG